MNINPISFGRTIKIDAPPSVAERTAQLINGKKSICADRKEKKAQAELKNIFFDVDKGSAQAVFVDETSYIVTGDESKKVSDFKLDKAIHIIEGQRKCKKSSEFHILKQDEEKRYNGLLKTLVSNTLEPMVISPKYCINSMYCDSHVESTTARIKSVNFVI